MVMYSNIQNILILDRTKVKHSLALLLTVYGVWLLTSIEGEAKPSMDITNRTNFQRQSVTNLISKSMLSFCIHMYTFCYRNPPTATDEARIWIMMCSQVHSQEEDCFVNVYDDKMDLSSLANFMRKLDLPSNVCSTIL